MKNTMKKALSLLVVFAMVCVPMIANAAVGDGVAMPENCIYSGDTVSVEAGATTYFEIGTNMTAGTYDFIVEGAGDFDVAVCTEGSGEYPYAEGTPVAAVDGKVETTITSFESTYSYAAFSITNNTDAVADYDITIVFPVGSQGNPELVTLVVGESIEVVVPADAAYYIEATLPQAFIEFELTVSGNTGFRVGNGMGMPTPDTAGSYVGTIASYYGPASLTLLNNTAEEQTYTVSIDNMPAGSSEGNPEILTESGDYVASFANGHFYQFTAVEAGTITVAMTDADGWQYQLNGVRADETYYYGDMHWCDDDPVVASESVEVAVGDVYTVYVVAYNTAATTVNWTFTFEATAGGEDPVDPPVEPPVEKPAYDENGPTISLLEGTETYAINADYVYTLYNFEPTKEGDYTITVADALIGIVSNNGMWVNTEPDADTVSATSVEWECTGVGQSIWVAVISEAETVSITVEYSEPVVVVIPEIDYENVVTPEEFVYDGDTANFDYVDTFDEIVDTAVLGDDGYYHLNAVDGPIIFACLNDSVMSLVDANGYGQLNYIEYDEDGNVVSKTYYATAFGEYVDCAYTDDAGSMYYPLTVDLMVMFQKVGEGKGWYGEYGFVGGDLEDAWMFACYYDETVTSLEPDTTPDYDLNDDGEFNMYDYMLVKATYFKADATDEEKALADVNGDGILNMFDYVAIKAAYFL